MAMGARFFIFRSGASDNMNAFSYDRTGERLPAKWKPWTNIGVVRPDQRPPHNLDRDAIEAALAQQGFALWRMKEKT
jgi:hypothetical protein